MEAKTLALYLGCQVQIFMFGSTPNHKGMLTGVDLECAYVRDGENTLTVRCFELKPILRPLSSMTTEEKSEYNKRKQRKGYMAEIHADNTLWLLSKCFDLFGLIEKGEAIDSMR